MKQDNFRYLQQHQKKVFPQPRQRITYSFHDQERTIVGYVEEDGDHIALYEYRGHYFGAEFLISFSRHSSTYKLLHTEVD